MESGDLSELPKGYNEDFCKNTIYAVSKGIQALHSHNILHRDLKAENVLYRDNNDI